MRPISKQLILIAFLALCPSSLVFGQRAIAKSNGEKSPAIVGDHNIVTYIEKNYLVKTEPQSSPATRRLLRDQAKVFLGDGLSGNGLLLPAKEPDPDSRCKQPRGSLSIYFGNGPGEISCSTRKACVLISDNSRSGNPTDINSPSTILALVKVGNNYQLEGKILGASGHVVALFSDDAVYTYKKEVSLVKRPDPATLIILDTQGNTMLDLHYLNRHAMTLQGTFYSQNGQSITVSNNFVSLPGGLGMSGNCLDNNGVGISF